MPSLKKQFACQLPRLQLLSILLALVLTSQHSIAQPEFMDATMASSTPDKSQALVEPAPAKPRISAAQAAELVRRETGGQIMSVSTRQGANGTIYGVKVLNSGRMKVIQVDGQTGQLLNH
jgi:uncharacterized membrane protein YkoI